MNTWSGLHAETILAGVLMALTLAGIIGWEIWERRRGR